jgi:formylglycine-generating enzyme required for sulfatase activity/serine/threonine protein kinase
MEDLIGKQLGSYQIVAQLGTGGMATVFKAYQPKMDRYVALKILPRHLSRNPEFSSRFSQEARIIAQLEHPHILPVHDFGESDGYTYLAMRLVKGGSLNDLLKRQGKLELNQIKTIITQVGEALDYAHNKGVIHRDFKPGNILMDEAGNCLLTDFGIAKLIEVTSHLTNPGGVLGTPVYISPEQGEGKPIDYRSDLYSLGVVLYQMVTGDVPYKADTPMAVIYKHIHDPIPLPGRRVSDLPESVERVILRSLAKDPNDRYTSAAEFIKYFQNAIEPPIAQEIHKREPDQEPTEVTKEYSAETVKSPIKSHEEPAKEKFKPKKKIRVEMGWMYTVLGILFLAVLSGAGWYYYKNILSMPILNIESDPSEADVYIDDGHVGTSPIKVQELELGTHKVRISKDLYEEHTEDIFIQKNNPRTVHAVLVPKPFGDLKVISNPDGADVFIDEVKKGVTPITLKDLPKGNRKVMIKKEGFDLWQGTVEIIPLKKADLSADLITIYGGVDISSKPSEADVYIDGNKIGKTPLVLEKVIKGKQNIEVRKQGFNAWKNTIEIKAAETAKVEVDLLTVFGSLNITSDPSEVLVSIDGKNVGQTPLQLNKIRKGKVKISIDKEGFDEWEQEIMIEPSKVFEVNAVLVSSFGSLKIETTPDGAQVSIDGKNVGQTPLQLNEVKRGKVKISIDKEGFDVWEHEIMVEASKVSEVNAVLVSSFGSLKVETTPDGAQVYIDGKNVGQTPLQLNEVKRGKVKIIVYKKGFDVWEQEIMIEPSKVSEVNAVLVSSFGSLKVETTPDGAQVYIDGKKQGESPLELKELKKGSHEVVFKKEGYKDFSQSIEVLGGQQVALQSSLSIAGTGMKITNSIGMEFVYIKPGTFMRGSPNNEKDRDSDEIQHQVTLTKGYYMGVTEVTQGQWKAIMGSNPSGFSSCGDDCPVEGVTYDDVKEFIQRLNDKEGIIKYRLPTEAEWEYACRAGSTARFTFGDSESELSGYAWHSANSGTKTHRVAMKKPNGWGLYDMHGNVWEWVSDWYGDYPSDSVIDPIGPSSGSHRINRGGSWNRGASFCRSADRDRFNPGSRIIHLGFRLARDI